jgi:hypothetical protein
MHKPPVDVNPLLRGASQGPEHQDFLGIPREHHPLAVAKANN